MKILYVNDNKISRDMKSLNVLLQSFCESLSCLLDIFPAQKYDLNSIVVKWKEVEACFIKYFKKKISFKSFHPYLKFPIHEFEVSTTQ